MVYVPFAAAGTRQVLYQYVFHFDIAVQQIMCREEEEEIAISSARSYATKIDLLAMTLKSLNHSK